MLKRSAYYAAEVIADEGRLSIFLEKKKEGFKSAHLPLKEMMSSPICI